MEKPCCSPVENSPIGGNVKIFACNSNMPLAKEIAEQFGVPLGGAEVTSFADGEIYTRVFETVRGADVYIIQSTSPPVNDNLMELLILTDAMKRASAGHINAVIPYFGYARQDRKTKPRDPISAKLVANLITTAGADRVVTMDLHCAQIQGFFDIPVDHLHGTPILADYYSEMFGGSAEDVVVVSPDLGSVARARGLAGRLNAPLAIVDKRRPRSNVAEVMNVIGDVKDMRVILADDMIDTGGSITAAAEAMRDKGAREVYACCTHPVLSRDAVARIEASPIKELLALNTIALPESKRSPKLRTLSVANIFAESIHRIHNGESISTLFD